MCDKISRALSFPRLISVDPPIASKESENKPDQNGSTRISFSPHSLYTFYHGGNCIQCLVVTKNSKVSKLGTYKSVDQILDISSSWDGRMVAFVTADGNLHCHDVTTFISDDNEKRVKIIERWVIKIGFCCNVSTSETIVCKSHKRNNIIPTQSISFSPCDKYHILIVDTSRMTFIILDASIENEKDRMVAQKKIGLNEVGNIGAACWHPIDPYKICVGELDGGDISILSIDKNRSISVIKKMSPPIDEYDENDEVPPWSCTHLYWPDDNVVAVGYGRMVFDEEISSENKREEGYKHENYGVHYETNLFICDPTTKLWNELGDIPSFFGVPKNGKHVFFTSFLSLLNNKFKVMIVGCNLSNDVAVICKNEQNNDVEWREYDLQDNASISAPITKDDELMYPTGIIVAHCSENIARILMTATDGSLNIFGVENKEIKDFSVINKHTKTVSVKPLNDKNPVVIKYRESSYADRCLPSLIMDSVTIEPSRTLEKILNKPEKKTTKLSNVNKIGSFTFNAVPSPSTSLYSENLLLSSSKSDSENKDIFNVNSLKIYSPKSETIHVKEILAKSGSKKEDKLMSTINESEMSLNCAFTEKYNNNTNTNEAMAAGRAFDKFDNSLKGTLPLSKFNDLLYEVSQEFPDDDCDKHFSLVDPNNTGFISRSAFVNWYNNFVDNGYNENIADDDSGNSLKANNRRNVKKNAVHAFCAIAGSNKKYMKIDKFNVLMETLGIPYSEVQYYRIINKVSDGEGNITFNKFIDWYMNRLLSHSDLSEDVINDNNENATYRENIFSANNESLKSQKSWEEIITLNTDSWMCESCMTTNYINKSKCVTCDNVLVKHKAGVNNMATCKECTEKSPNVSNTEIFFDTSGSSLTNDKHDSFPFPSHTPFRSTSMYSSFSSKNLTAPTPRCTQPKTVSDSLFDANSVQIKKKNEVFNRYYPVNFSSKEDSFSNAHSSGRLCSGSPCSKPETPFQRSNVKISVKSYSSKENVCYSSTQTRVAKYSVASEYEYQLWVLVRDFMQSLNNLKESMFGNFSNVGTQETMLDIKLLISDVANLNEKSKSDAMLIDGQIVNHRKFSLMLHSRKDDIARQISESRVLIDRQLQYNDDSSQCKDISKSQPLDIESEEVRHRITNASIKIKKTLTIARDRISLLEEIFDFPSGFLKKIISPNGIPCSVYAVSTEANKAVFKSLKEGFERVRQLDAEVDNLFKKVQDYRNHVLLKNTKHLSINIFPSDMDSNCGVSKKNTLLPLPFHPIIISSRQKKNTVTSLAVLSKVKKAGWRIIPKCFTCSQLICGYSDNTDELDEFRTTLHCNVKSHLMRSFDSSDNRRETLTFESSHSFSPFTSFNIDQTSIRSDWNNDITVDSAKMASMPLSLPKNLKHIYFLNAERQALAQFGTTPEKASEMLETKARWEMYSKLNTSVTEDKVNNRDKSDNIIEDTNKSQCSIIFSPSTSSHSRIICQPNLGNQSTLSPEKDSKLKFITNTQKNIIKIDECTEGAESKSLGVNRGVDYADTTFNRKDDNLNGSYFSGNIKTLSSDPSLQNDTVKIEKLSLIKENKDAKDISSSFLQFSELGEKLTNSLTDDPKQCINDSGNLNPFTSKEDTCDPMIQPNYHSILTQFYEEYNQSKVKDVARTLQKYKGQETQMFSKLAKKYNVPNPLINSANDDLFIKSSSDMHSLKRPDFVSILTNFYAKHNPSKIVEVQKTLQKYKGNEISMFDKLARKYNAPNPLCDVTEKKSFLSEETQSKKFNLLTFSSSFTQNTKLFDNGITEFGGISTSRSLADDSSIFRTNLFKDTALTFLKNDVKSIDQSTTPPLNFGHNPIPRPNLERSFFSNNTNALFGERPEVTTKFDGKTYRDILIEFYKSYNPLKISEVDKVLKKYYGQEDILFRNVAKKYNVDPSIFTLNKVSNTFELERTRDFSTTLNTPTQTFGQPSALSSNAPCGGFRSSPHTSLNSFASLSHTNQSRTGFGSLASADSTSFSSLSDGKVNILGRSLTSSFGAPRR